MSLLKKSPADPTEQNENPQDLASEGKADSVETLNPADAQANAESQSATTAEPSETQQPKVDPVLKSFIYLESAYRNQEILDDKHIVIPRSTPEKIVSFRDLITQFFPGLVERIGQYAILTQYAEDRVGHNIELASDVYLDRTPFVFLFHRNEDGSASVVDNSSTLSLSYKAEDGKLQYLNITVKSIGQTPNSVYARVTFMKPHEGVDNKISGQSECMASTISCIMPCDMQDVSEEMKEFDTIAASVKAKMEKQAKLDVYEDEFVHGANGMYFPGYNIGYANWLFERHRVYDAYVIYQRVYNAMRHELPSLDKEIQPVFYHACFCMGLCMQQLGFMDKAAYYLQLASTGNQQYISAYVEVLALASHNRFYLFLNQLRSQVGKAKGAEEEVKRLEEVAATAEKNHKVPEQIDLSQMPLGYVLLHEFDVVPECLKSLVVCKMDPESKSVEATVDQTAIWNMNLYDLADTLVYIRYSRTKEETGITYDESSLCGHNCIVLNIQSVESEDKKSYVRVNAMIPNFGNNDDKLALTRCNRPRFASFVLGATPAGEVMQVKQLSEIFTKAVALKEDGRVFEAMRCFEYIHHALKIEYTKVSATDEMENLFFDATYELGFCLLELDLYERATYYLDLVQEAYKVDYAREYVNCLCNNDDIRALDVINGILSSLQKPSDPQFMQSYEYCMSFMRRRKAYVLLNRHLFDEAEKLLKEMLNDPLSKDFAQAELDFLQKAKQ